MSKKDIKKEVFQKLLGVRLTKELVNTLHENIEKLLSLQLKYCEICDAKKNCEARVAFQEMFSEVCKEENVPDLIRFTIMIMEHLAKELKSLTYREAIKFIIDSDFRKDLGL